MLMTFGEAMTSLIKKKNLSASNVAAALGFKNKTAFFRILHDESRMPAIENCFMEAKRSDLLNLSEEEKQALYEAVRVSEFGRQVYRFHRVLYKMICPSSPDDSPANAVCIVGMDGINTFDELIDHLGDDQVIGIKLIGRCSKHVLDRLHRLTQERNIDRIIHYFAVDENDPEDVKIFSEISDILFSGAYHPYYVNETNLNRKKWWLRSGMILLDLVNSREESSTIQLAWMDSNRYLCVRNKYSVVWDFLQQIIGSESENMVSLKMENSDVASTGMQDYVDFTKRYLQIENNREIFSIRPDIPIYCIPVDIVATPVIEAFAQVYPQEEQQFREQISRLYGVHKQRVDNLFKKKKNTYIVLNRDAMLNFARTGSRSDHFFMTRPYTPQERVQVLEIFRDQAQDNPNFHILIANHPDLVWNKEVTVYDGYGVALVKGGTSWQLDGDHQEILLRSRMLAQYFMSFFKNEVLRHAVFSREESLAMIDEWIKIAGEM